MGNLDETWAVNALGINVRTFTYTSNFTILLTILYYSL